MVLHFDKLSIKEFFQYGGQVIDESKSPIYIFEEEFNKILRENVDYFKDSSKYKCKLGEDFYDFNSNTEEFTNKTFVDISIYNVPKNDPISIPNVCFSLIGRNDIQAEEYRKQRMERGFDDSELWALNTTIARFILPRLIAFRDNYWEHPPIHLTAEEWKEILNKMIAAFDIYLNYSSKLTKSEDYIRKCYERGTLKGRSLEKCLQLHTDFEEGMNYFNEYWMSLWD